MVTCSVDGCGKKVKRLGLCNTHYRRLKKYGDLNAPDLRGLGRVPVGTRLERRTVKQPDGCWIWTGRLDSRTGYGRFQITERNGLKRTVTVHRAAYEHYVGPIPEGLVIDHLCRNRACINPDHLEAVTQRENILRGTSVQARNAAKTHCKHGHPFDEANTYWTRAGHRSCRACWARRRAA